MGIYKYIREAWRNPSPEQKRLYKERLVLWRRQPVTIRIERPTRLDRARSLGYKAKKGIIIIRQKVNRGGRMRPKIRKGRRPRHFRRRKVLNMNYQTVAEQRAVRDYPNCEVLNSYFAGQDGLSSWYEVILIDKAHPEILADPRFNWIAEKQHKSRVHRGLTSSAKKSRGLRRKGKGAEKLRPSKAAVWRKKADRKGLR